MTLYDVPVPTLDGSPTTLREHEGEVLLAVNVASKCGFTPQYEGLEALHARYRERGFSVLGFPCNQFLFQEPGGADAITACTLTYGVTFPVYGKLKVRGRDQHPLYALLTEAPDDGGKAGRVKWNFEKFLVGRDGTVLKRYRSRTTPEQIEADVAAALEGRPLGTTGA
ncbi:MAG: glutathione peroxidase [Frankiales bacterium]|nr:glutathione peroxidase [Frankiales bacterium]